MLSSIKLLNSLCVKSRITVGAGGQHLLFGRSLATNTAVDSPMARLRRKTGYAFSLCRKALDLHSQDMDKAEQWLRAEAVKQGWERAERVRNRPAAEGLIGVVSVPDKRLAAMLELNCETDFVARNQLFSELATTLTLRLTEQQLSAFDVRTQHEDGAGVLLSKIEFLPKQLTELCPDLVVDAIGKLGENIRIAKACIVYNNSDNYSGNVQLVGYAHAVGGRVEASDQSVLLGKYGTIVTLGSEPVLNDLGEYVTKTGEEVEEIGKQLSQHIIGLNPKTIEPTAQRPATAQPSEEAVPVEETDRMVEEESTALLEQQFVFDDELTVRQFLKDSNIKVLDFVRFECGVNE